MSEAVVIDTPDGIEHFQFARCLAALKIEVRTGMTLSRGSMLAHVQRTYGVQARTKTKALDEMLALYRKRYGRDYGS